MRVVVKNTNRIVVQVSERTYASRQTGKSRAITIYDAPIEKVYEIIYNALMEASKK